MKNFWFFGLFCANAFVVSHSKGATFENICGDDSVRECPKIPSTINAKGLELVPCATTTSLGEEITFDLAHDLFVVIEQLKQRTINFKGVSSLVCQDEILAIKDEKLVLYPQKCEAYVTTTSMHGASMRVAIDVSQENTTYSLLIDTMKKVGVPNDGRKGMYTLNNPECLQSSNGILSCTFEYGVVTYYPGTFKAKELPISTAKSCFP